MVFKRKLVSLSKQKLILKSHKLVQSKFNICAYFSFVLMIYMKKRHAIQCGCVDGSCNSKNRIFN